MFAAGEVDYLAKTKLGLGNTSSAIIGGMGGGIAQAVKLTFVLTTISCVF